MTKRVPPADPGQGEDVADPAAPATSAEQPSVRLRDARSLRALAHPVRVALLGALRAYGPLTATQAAGYVEDTPSNCSFHLRTLASFGLIEQVLGQDSRQRPWKVVDGSISYQPDDQGGSREAGAAAAMVLHQYLFEQYERWLDREPEAPDAWREAAFDRNTTTSMTAAELSDVEGRIAAMMQPYVDRRRLRQASGVQPGPDELPVRLIFTAFPAQAPNHRSAATAVADCGTDTTRTKAAKPRTAAEPTNITEPAGQPAQNPRSTP